MDKCETSINLTLRTHRFYHVEMKSVKADDVKEFTILGEGLAGAVSTYEQAGYYVSVIAEL